jgi:hypothetical protein
MTCSQVVHHSCTKPDTLPASPTHCPHCGGNPSLDLRPDYSTGGLSYNRAKGSDLSGEPVSYRGAPEVLAPNQGFDSYKKAAKGNALGARVLVTSFLGLFGLGLSALGWSAIRRAQETPDVKLLSPQNLWAVDQQIAEERRLRKQFLEEERLPKKAVPELPKNWYVQRWNEKVAERAAESREDRVGAGYFFLALGVFWTIGFICCLFGRTKKGPAQGEPVAKHQAAT